MADINIEAAEPLYDIEIEAWQPLRLILDQIGPFRQGPETFNFRGPDENGDPKPANIYMLLAKNGRGKTTALEAIYGLFGLMADPPTGRFATPRATGERAQIDIRVGWRDRGGKKSCVLSIWTGSREPLEAWSDEEVIAAGNAQSWERLVVSAVTGEAQPIEPTSDFGLELFRAIRAQRRIDPSQLYGASQTMPTVLYFTADRRIVAPLDERAVMKPAGWGYQPAQIFASDGPEWAQSIDNLLVWLEWVGDDRVDDLINFLNQQLFVDTPGKVLRRPRRQDLASYISTRTGEHSLLGLSHGERSLLQLYARTLCHMTASTILLIDEVENHLHPRWAQRLYSSLKDLFAQAPGLMTIFTTHSMALMETYKDDVAEPGIVRGGFLIEEDMN
ncbi:AAA family ATPase [Sphingopyxis sp.]|uniref:AAA family ATPase n=1 Tax=Sphingopyxis sp. TaxID=1908224 RepID=UPI002B48F4B5|nr:AAA family ATPase [Sphingopyxis sp.]HJS11613.1 AAA family ATPase [Sphingopyxis sp.]